MGDIKLFQLANNGQATELKGEASHLEKPLQNLIEKNLEPLLGVRFIATEHPTGKVHGGYIPTPWRPALSARAAGTSTGSWTTRQNSNSWSWRNSAKKPQTTSTGQPPESSA